MKSIGQLFEEAWDKKNQRGWEFVYIMVDLHGVVLPSNYHKETDLQFISPYAQMCLKWLSNQKDVILILWSSSHETEILRVRQLLQKNGVWMSYVNENPIEHNTDYADFSKKPYFSVVLDDKAGFEPSDWRKLADWIAIKEQRESI